MPAKTPTFSEPTEANVCGFSVRCDQAGEPMLIKSHIVPSSDDPDAAFSGDVTVDLPLPPAEQAAFETLRAYVLAQFKTKNGF